MFPVRKDGHLHMATNIKTQELHPYVRKLIKDLRDGMGGAEAPEKFLKAQEARANDPNRRFDAQRKPRRFSPREVKVVFQPGAHVTHNVAAFSFQAVNGVEVSRAGHETWTGSDGEPNYTQQVTYQGPTVSVWGYGRNLHTELSLATGLSDESTTDANGNYLESPHRRAVAFFSKQLASGNTALLQRLVDAALEGKAFPVVVPEQAEQDNAAEA